MIRINFKKEGGFIHYIARLFKSYLFYTTSAFGISLTIKANVGVSSFNSMNIAIANAADIKVGTITTFINMAFLLGFMILTHFTLRKKYMIQTLSVILFGMLINCFTYTVLKDLIVENYVLRLLLISLGTTIGGLSVGMIISYDAITFPIESFCLAIAERTKFTFVKLRYFIDIFSVTISLIVSFSFALPLYVREGTVISLLILSAAMNFSKELYSRYTLGKVTT
ncbi:YczE/YyaS/YitT family protein [Fusibacter ferrireducens]|uniref:YczE/YyaS/YitT family protein n=1 Tax=Fusibacter ferrireducens TaxID=2785058 RepID=UPI001A9B5772|nr:hypothetical protein [Fusibacter ferrireducens]